MRPRTRQPRASTTACTHGGAFWSAIGDEFDHLERRADVINADVLDAWFPPAPRILEAAARHLEWLLRTSPPTGCEGLIRALARARGVPEASVLVGDGSSSLMFQALCRWLGKSSRVLLPDPTYGEYAHLFQHVIGCRLERLELSPASGFQLDPETLAARLRRRRFDLVVLVNPNSPTGLHVPRQALERVLARAPAATRFWVDETYVEYAGEEESLERFAARRRNVVVCKSMSKVYALSGVRVGYLCAHASLIAELRSRVPPWAVSLPAQLAAVLAVGEPTYYASRWAETRALRAELSVLLTERLGIAVTPSAANFLLCELPASGIAAKTLVERCRARGLYLRELSSVSTLFGPRHFRIAVKESATNERMVRVLEKVCRGK